MRHEEGSLEGVGGLALFRQAWLPDSAPKAVVVLSHGASEHSARYAHVGSALAAVGYALHALDHRGHGRSEGARAYLDRLDNAVADLHGLVAHAKSAHPGLPLFLLGHSAGGCIALRYTHLHADDLTGLALSSPVAALEAAGVATRVAAKVLSSVFPRLGVLAVDASGVSRDPEEVQRYEADPLVFHGKLPVRTVAELAAAVARFPEEVTAFRLPLLVLLPTGDRIVPPAGGEMVYERAGSSDKTIKRYEGLYHEGFNEPERDQVIGDLIAWLDAHV